MILEIKNSQGESRPLSSPTSTKKLWNDINKFMEEHHFKSYYKRLWFEDDKLKIDVGSWSEFFYVSELTEKDIQELNISDLLPR